MFPIGNTMTLGEGIRGGPAELLWRRFEMPLALPEGPTGHSRGRASLRATPPEPSSLVTPSPEGAKGIRDEPAPARPRRELSGHRVLGGNKPAPVPIHETRQIAQGNQIRLTGIREQRLPGLHGYANAQGLAHKE